MGIVPLTIVLFGIGVASEARDGPVAALRNGGFESPRFLEGWEVVTYGADAKVEPDRNVVREGRQALRVSAEEPSDTALGQEVEASARPMVPIPRLGAHPRSRPTRCTGLWDVSGSDDGRAKHDRGGREPPGRYRLDAGRAGLPGACRRSRADRAVPRRLRQGTRHCLVRRPGPRGVRAGSNAGGHHPRTPSARSDRARPVRPVHRVSLRPRAGDVGRQALRRRISKA